MIIGIDLGTSFSLASYYEPFAQEAKLIPNQKGSFLTPSQVHFHNSDRDKIHVGDHPEDPDYTLTLSRFKDSMGTNRIFHTEFGDFTPTFLSAMVLKQLKADAEAHLNEEVTEAIISVPAYFNDKQRTATRAAGEMAGLATTRLVNEPSAAALAYQMSFDEVSLLVIDFGGGTLDVSVVDCFDNIVEILAIGGNTHLGGNQINGILERYCRDNWNIDLSPSLEEREAMDFQMETHDPTQTQYQNFHQSMETQEEIAQQALQRKERAFEITAQDFYRIYPLSPQQEAFRDELIAMKEILAQNSQLIYCRDNKEYILPQQALFPAIHQEIFKPIANIIQKAMSDSKKSFDDIDHVILVGGSSHLFGFADFIQGLTGKKHIAYHNPQTVVAMGMGLYSGIKRREEKMGDYILTDVCPFTLGMATVHSKYDPSPSITPLIPRNTSVPATATSSFATIHDNQPKISVDVYQGEHFLAKDNLCLANILVPVPPGKAGDEKIHVSYTYDLNGILQVDIKTSQEEFHHTLFSKETEDLSPETVETLRQQLAEYKLSQDKHEDNQLLRRANELYHSLGQDAKRFMRKAIYEYNMSQHFSHIDARKAEHKLDFFLFRLETWMTEPIGRMSGIDFLTYLRSQPADHFPGEDWDFLGSEEDHFFPGGNAKGSDPKDPNKLWDFYDPTAEWDYPDNEE